MIVQNTNMNQGAPPARPSSDVAPKAVVHEAVVNTPVQPSSQQLDSAVAAINQVMQQSNNTLEFSVDTSTKKPIVRLVDTSTGELIRQFPSKEVLAIAQSIDQFLHQQGLLLNQKG